MKRFVAIALIALTVLTVAPAWAQLYNTASLHVTGTSLYVKGHFHNAGTVTNGGLIAVTLDWYSKGAYAGEGTVALNGASPQKITHHTRRLHRLVVDGNGIKYVKGALYVDDKLELQHGVMAVTPGNDLVLGPQATAVGGSSSSYVDGPLTVEGEGHKFFPIGKNGTYAPIALTDVVGTDVRFSFELFEDAPAIAVDAAIVRHAHYWQRTDLRGDYAGSPVSVTPDPAWHLDPERSLLVTGHGWDDTFETMSFHQEGDTPSLTTHMRVHAPIILLGEADNAWRGGDYYLANALSPHASHSTNRSAKLFAQQLADEGFRFQVFDRAGRLIFETTSLEEMNETGWDGRARDGRMMMSGAYPYRLIGVDKTGRPFSDAGVITVVH